MDRLTHQTRWTNDIDLKQEYGYKHIYQRLCEYENTGLTPEEIEQLKAENKEMKELLVMAIADISAVEHCGDGFKDKTKFIELPCNIGDYCLYDGKLFYVTVVEYAGDIDDCAIWMSDAFGAPYGVEVSVSEVKFISKEEAKSILDKERR